MCGRCNQAEAKIRPFAAMSDSALRFPISRPLPEWAKRRPKRGTRPTAAERQPGMKGRLPPLVPQEPRTNVMDSRGYQSRQQTAAAQSPGILAESSIWVMPKDTESIRVSATRTMKKLEQQSEALTTIARPAPEVRYLPVEDSSPNLGIKHSMATELLDKDDELLKHYSYVDSTHGTTDM